MAAVVSRLHHKIPRYRLPAMPAISPPSTVLLTGATGYIAIWIARSLLDQVSLYGDSVNYLDY